jgi:hypothetical protein
MQKTASKTKDIAQLEPPKPGAGLVTAPPSPLTPVPPQEGPITTSRNGACTIVWPRKLEF